MIKKFKLHQKILTTLILAGALIISCGGISYASSTSSGYGQCTPPPGANPKNAAAYCYSCSSGGSQCGDSAASTQCSSSHCNLVNSYLNPTIDLLSGLVGIIVVIGLMIGAIQYATSAGDPQKAAKARGRMINAGVALLGFAFLYAFLQWIVPGGIFH